MYRTVPTGWDFVRIQASRMKLNRNPDSKHLLLILIRILMEYRVPGTF
jgi:hypothetical protein